MVGWFTMNAYTVKLAMGISLALMSNIKCYFIIKAAPPQSSWALAMSAETT